MLVIGGGPAGSSCAYWLADAGWDVAVVEKKHFPRVKTCGDGLTPRAVRQLADMGLEDALAGSHKYGGLRAYGFGRSIEMPWPEHPNFPNYGYTITRHDLDGLVAERAVKAGATLLAGTEVIAPIIDEAAVPSSPALPHLTGVTVREGGKEGGRSASCTPATSWWPTGPTHGSAGCWAPTAAGTCRWAWRCGATTPRTATTIRS